MKKFSTIALLLALSSSVFASDESNPTPTNCSFLSNAPDQHLVVRGDTLWGISEMFLEHPWCWPQVWDINRDEIENPHWIYPGQIVLLDRAAGRLRLGEDVTDRSNSSNGRDSDGNSNGKNRSSNGKSGSSPIKILPQTRGRNMGDDAIPTIPSNEIEPFLLQPLILDESELKNSPRIVATEEGHVNVGKNEKAYVLGDLKGIKTFQVFSQGTPLKDPETKRLLGYQFIYLGTVKLLRESDVSNEAHSFIVTNSKEEMTVGDRLRPVPNAEITNYVPHAPASSIDARVVSIYGGIAQAGQHQSITINRGTNDGLDIGTVLQLYRRGLVVPDKTSHGNVKLPDEQYGTLFIYRVFHSVSYGLVMQVRDSVQIGDVAKTPE